MVLSVFRSPVSQRFPLLNSFLCIFSYITASRTGCLNSVFYLVAIRDLKQTPTSQGVSAYRSLTSTPQLFNATLHACWLIAEKTGDIPSQINRRIERYGRQRACSILVTEHPVRRLDLHLDPLTIARCSYRRLRLLLRRVSRQQSHQQQLAAATTARLATQCLAFLVQLKSSLTQFPGYDLRSLYRSEFLLIFRHWSLCFCHLH